MQAQRPQITPVLRTRACYFEKLAVACFIQITLETILLYILKE
jgi:hypothetical protein